MHFEFIEIYDYNEEIFTYQTYLVEEGFYRSPVCTIRLLRRETNPAELQRRALNLLDMLLSKPEIKKG